MMKQKKIDGLITKTDTGNIPQKLFPVMSELFPKNVNANDTIYAAIRDCEDLKGDRVALEKMWIVYRQYADPHFLREIRDHFIQRYWEMLVTCMILRAGHTIQSAPDGPDIVVITQGKISAYIEAVAPSGGTGKDQVREPIDSTFWVSHDGIMLRYLSAIQNKHQQYLDWLKEGRVDPSVPYIIALNSRGIPMAVRDANPPRIVQALYGIGPSFVELDKKSLQIIRTGSYSKRAMMKCSGIDIALDGFITEKKKEISAIIYGCTPNPGIHENILDKITLAHNSHAKNPLPRNWLGGGVELSFDGKGVARTVVTSEESNLFHP